MILAGAISIQAFLLKRKCPQVNFRKILGYSIFLKHSCSIELCYRNTYEDRQYNIIMNTDVGCYNNSGVHGVLLYYIIV